MILKKTVKTGLAATGVLSALFAAGCTSVVQTPVDQLMSEQIVVPSAKPGTQIAGIPSADDIQAMAQMETEVANARAKAMEEKRIAAAAAAAAAREQAALCAAGAANTATATTAPGAGAPAAKAAPAVNCPTKSGDPVTAAAQKSGPTVELAEAVNTPATSVNSSLAYAAPPLPASSDAFAAQTEAMQGSGIVMASAPASMTIAMAAPDANNGRINLLISKYASMYGVPETLVHRVAKRESTYNPRAQHRGNYGLMQIRYNTAKSLGYDGAPTGLLDAETNLKYAVKYLRGAWIVAGKNEKAADWLYRTGYYYDAKRKGLLDDIQ